MTSLAVKLRGGHAFKEQKEFIIVLSGSLDVVVFDGHEEKIFSLNRSYYGLYVPNGLWRHMDNFATNTVAMSCFEYFDSVKTII